MNYAQLEKLIQVDPGKRGLEKLFEKNRGGLEQATKSILQTANPHIGLVTGFPILSAGMDETDGPIGTFFLARMLLSKGMAVTLIAEKSTAQALLLAAKLTATKSDWLLLDVVPTDAEVTTLLPESLTHLIAIERVGPAADGECYNMRGMKITEQVWPTHRFFEDLSRKYITLGIGDGGNEIGMGALGEEVMNNIHNGRTIACRVKVDHLIVAGISNWGAFALAAGLIETESDASTFQQMLKEETALWRAVLNSVQLVDGVLGRPDFSVDGVGWEEQMMLLEQLKDNCVVF